MTPEEKRQFEGMKRMVKAMYEVADNAFIANLTRRLNDSFSIPVFLSDLSDVDDTAPSTGEVLKYNGTQWAPGTDIDT